MGCALWRDDKRDSVKSIGRNSLLNDSIIQVTQVGLLPSITNAKRGESV